MARRIGRGPAVNDCEAHHYDSPHTKILTNFTYWNFQARIAFLQGERKGQENLKNDLVRRIKMLEYALKQERAKYAKLKYGGDSGPAIVAANALDATR